MGRALFSARGWKERGEKTPAPSPPGSYLDAPVILMPPSLAPARSRSVHRFSFFSSLSDHLIANDASGASIRRRRNPPVDLCLRKNGGGRGKEERACFFLPPSHPNIKILLLQKHERKKREGGKGKRNGKTAVGAFLRPRLSALTNSSPTFGSNGKVIMRSQLGKKRGRRGGSDRACPWGGGGGRTKAGL